MAIADALAARGPDVASWRAGAAQLVVRAVMPTVSETPNGALLLDGDASPSELAAAYAERGPRGLVKGREAYTLILADLRRGALVLARNGDGPPLYWSRHGGTTYVASEPVALLAAGVPAAPDPETLARFLATGACDDSPATFFAGVRRVLPGQVVELTRDAIRAHEPVPTPVAAVDLSGRLGVRLGAGVRVPALLGAALAQPGRPQPLPVYSVMFPELDRGRDAAGLLGRFPAGSIRHRALPFFVDEIDVDAYLQDLGEPTPQLEDWLRWAVARRVAGEVDALLDTGGQAHLSRLADRVATRFGVALRLVPAEPEAEPVLAELLPRLRTELVTSFLQPRHTGQPLADALRLLSGRGDPAALWRRYLVERWLRCVLRSGDSTPAKRPEQTVTVAGRRWVRRPVRTELLAAGDKIPEKLAWYVGEAVAGASPLAEPTSPKPAGSPARRANGQWYVLVAAKPLAVMQGRARPLWAIRPARLLHRLVRWQCSPWALRVAVDEVGRWRAVRGSDPRVRAIREPREDALPPGQVAVVPPPAEPDRVAAELVATLRGALPESAYATLGGCAVITAGGEVLGWAGRSTLPDGVGSGDPFGDEQTPIVVVTRATGQ